jgi:hypothetical protein
LASSLCSPPVVAQHVRQRACAGGGTRGVPGAV